MHRQRPPSMKICMKSLSGQGRKSPMMLFIIAVQFYGGRALCWDVPERNAQHLQGSGAFYFYKDVGGSSVKIWALENYVVTVKTD